MCFYYNFYETKHAWNVPVRPSFQLKHIYLCLKPCKQGHNSLLHHWISVRWLWGKYLAWLCVMSVQWNLVLRAEGKCPLARRCAQNLKPDDEPCVRPENPNVHMIGCRGVAQTRQPYRYEANVDVCFLSCHFKGEICCVRITAFNFYVLSLS